MEEQSYIIPANSKKSKFIFGIFRGIDLAIFAIGVSLTFALLFAIRGTSTGLLILKLAPAGIACFLVMPFPNYHNVLCLIREIIEFYFNRRIYLWKGWCLSNVTEEKK